MGYHPGALPAVAVGYLPIPEGDAGLRATLLRIAENIHTYNPLTDQLAAELAHALPGATETELAASVYHWVKRHMVYIEEVFPTSSEISDSIATPDAIVSDIVRSGKARGDCSHYSTLLGAIYTRLGWPVTLVWVKTLRPDGSEENHVFPLVETDEGEFAADGIIAEWEFGMEVPADEQIHREELAV